MKFTGGAGEKLLCRGVRGPLTRAMGSAASKGSHDTFLLDLPDDILELILLSLHSPLWLVWATSTCKRWRRIISTVGFTRRFHAIHSRRPVVAGSYHNDYNNDGYMQPRFGPSPFATAIHASNFSLNFLPGSYNNKWRWMIEDSPLEI
ncbi:hypothetical protein HU200_067222 [Digitaria exilis]|uniref:F-box domain-containing protein n=1 Tax=Digitaria exilis TaxID=1010633 RepID=A0A835A0P0_9POAL|nr:hypothetical protein HU200_067222 [Digitaria exilis]